MSKAWNGAGRGGPPVSGLNQTSQLLLLVAVFLSRAFSSVKAAGESCASKMPGHPLCTHDSFSPLKQPHEEDIIVVEQETGARSG